MSDVIGLSKVRKTRARTDRKAKADENALKSGRTKAQRDLENARADKARKMLSAHARDDT